MAKIRAEGPGAKPAVPQRERLTPEGDRLSSSAQPIKQRALCLLLSSHSSRSFMICVIYYTTSHGIKAPKLLRTVEAQWGKLPYV